MAYVNRFKKLLEEKKYVIGTGVYIREPAVAEMLGALYDFIWIDWEHTWLDRGHILSALIACRAAGTASLVRVPWNDPVLAKPILEMGPDGIIFPQIHNAAEARAAIAACTYPPDGIRGWGPGRAVEYGAIPALQYVEESCDRVFKVLQVESMECIEALDEILELKGMDCLCVGPMDLSASVGKLAQTRDPKVLAAYDKIGEIAAKHSVPLMISYGFSPAELEEWKDRGVRLFHVDGDLGLMRSAALHELRAIRRMCYGPDSEDGENGGVTI
jgi:2-dehydro-3-deoxyglucarate aldolase/4-hydroxy-2-oxoheptanedioate aldolase